jgi:hypothetical protein
MSLESAQAAQRAAHSILSEARFRAPSVPDPLHGALVWIGRIASDPLSAIGKLVDRAGSDFPGGVTGVWAVAAAVLLVATGILASRRAKVRLERWSSTTVVNRPRPEQLERDAERAERDGRWLEAVRLRFQAGLLRLDERHGFGYTETTPNHSLARLLDSKQLELVSHRFDEIIYGGDQATAVDAERQRQAWSEILTGDER